MTYKDVRPCEFKTASTCELAGMCIRRGLGDDETHSVNFCALYWKLKAARAIKRLRIPQRKENFFVCRGCDSWVPGIMCTVGKSYRDCEKNINSL